MKSQRNNHSGIYYIRHTESGKTYVGSAVNIARRWKGHRCTLRTAKHSNSYLQAAWAKYGEDAFEWGVLERVDDPRRLIEREQHWIDLLETSKREHGYNICKVAGNSLGRKASLETRLKHAERMRGNKHTAGKPLSVSHKKAISTALRGRLRISDRQKQLISDRLSLVWKVTKPDGEVLTVRSLHSFAKENGVSNTVLHHLADGTTKKNRRGWKCERISPSRRDEPLTRKSKRYK